MRQLTETLTTLTKAIDDRSATDAHALLDLVDGFHYEEDTTEGAARVAVHDLCAAAEGLLGGDLDTVRRSLLGAAAITSLYSSDTPQEFNDATLSIGEALYEIAPDNLPVNGYLAMRLYDGLDDPDIRDRARKIFGDLVTALEAPDADEKTGVELSGVYLYFVHDVLAELNLGVDVREAAEHGRRALELAPEDASEDCYLAQALEAADRMDLEDALGFLARIQEYSSPSRRYLVELKRAQWLVMVGRAEEALAQLEALEVAPGQFPDNDWSRDLVLSKGMVCCELERDLDWVVASCSDLLRADPEDFDARVRLSAALGRTGRLDETREQVDYLLSLNRPDMVLYFTAGVLHKLLGMRAKERGASFAELDALYGTAARYLGGNGELLFMHVMHEDQIGYVGYLLGEAIYDEAARIGNGGHMQGALDFLHAREESSFSSELSNWLYLSLAEAYSFLAQNGAGSVYRSQALRYIEKLEGTDDLDPSVLVEMRARLG